MIESSCEKHAAHMRRQSRREPFIPRPQREYGDAAAETPSFVECLDALRRNNPEKYEQLKQQLDRLWESDRNGRQD